MNINRVWGKNLLTLGEFDLELADRGLILIQGDNQDDPSAESNGAGKSSVPDVIAWVLYGITARGVSADGIVNRRAKKDAEGHVELDDDGQIYQISRYRKHSVHKNEIFVRRQTPGGWVDLHKGTAPQTQEVINKIMGCSVEVFQAAVYAGQEKMPDLPAMTDKQLKVLIEEAAGVEVLEKAYALANKQATETKAAVVALQGRLDTAVNAVELANAEVKRLEAEVVSFETGRKGRAASALAGAPAIAQAIETMKEELTRIDIPALQAERATIQNGLAARASEEAALEALRREQREAQRALDAVTFDAQRQKREVERLHEAIRKIDGQVGSPCGECGKPYCEHDLETARLAQQTKVKAALAELGSTAAKFKQLKEKLQTASAKVDAYRASMTDVSKETARLAELDKALDAGRKLEKQIAEKASELQRLKDTAALRLKELNPHQAQVAAAKARLEAQEKAVDELRALRHSKEDELLLHEDVAKVFSPSGVRAHILDTITPFLNDRTADVLGALSDGNLKAVWSTLKRSAKGELKERFNIDVTNDTGAESFAGCSGGEKRKVRLATALALQDAVASRATKPINLFIGDEIDHALDESGLERLMGVLTVKARERGTVLVISHNALSDWIPDVITVTKKGGQSTLSGATRRVGVF